jgi:hypothetical protein
MFSGGAAWAKAEGVGAKIGLLGGWAGTAAAIAVPAGQILGDALGSAIYPAVARMREWEESLKHMDEAMEEGVRIVKKFAGTAMGTHQAGLVTGLNVEAETKLAALQEIYKNRVRLGGLGSIGVMAGMKRLREAGFDPGELERMKSGMFGGSIEHEIGRLSGEISSRKARLEGASTATDVGIKSYVSHLDKNHRESINVAKAQEELLKAELQLFMTDKRFMTPEEITKFMKEHEKDLLTEQAKINQTVNVHIEQVSAKDPDRWLADLDDYAARRARSRTRARSAQARGH